jgi:hypothetical protein
MGDARETAGGDVKLAEGKAAEVNTAGGLGERLQTKRKTNKNLADEVELSVDQNAAPVVRCSDSPVDRITGGGELEGAGLSGSVTTGGSALPKGVMGPVVVVVVSPEFQSAGCLRQGMQRLASDLGLKDAVHLLMSVVVNASFAVNELHPDAQPVPPKAYAGEVVGAYAAKRNASVGADRLGQAMAAEQAQKHAAHRSLSGERDRCDCEQITRMQVAHRQRFDALSARGAKPAFEVRGPYIVGAPRDCRCTVIRSGPGAFTNTSNAQAGLLKPALKGALAWQSYAWRQ